ncbi:MAG: hypothetical protein GW913_07230 [Myxococcales bacterium]|nr:hypothetical protein [Myxococcales bacterium]
MSFEHMPRVRASCLLSLSFLLAACGTTSSTPTDAGLDGSHDAGLDGSHDAGLDAATTSLRACPGVADCSLLTPVEEGLPASGAGAAVDQVALRPSASTRSQLLVHFNGSGGTPLGAVADPSHNFFTVARDEGLHVLAISYRSGQAIALLCPPSSATRDACYEPTRLSVLTGVPQPGAAAALSDITSDEGAFTRIVAALTTLASADPDGGWDDFLDPSAPDAESSIRWDKLLVSGHSQGGGHAVLLGKLHAVARVIMLASPCDSVSGAPASWVTRTAAYQTDASRFFGLGVASDRLCPTQFAAWTALGMPAAAGDDTASLCAGVDAHGAPVACVENESRWRTMLR